MQKRLYAILDTLAGMLAGGVILLPNDEAAIRFFGDVISQENNVSRHPKDHELICLGLYDENSISIDPFVGKVVVFTGEKYLAAKAAFDAAAEASR